MAYRCRKHEQTRERERKAESMTDPTVAALAAKYAKTPGQLVLRWHIELGVAAIPKSANPVRIAQNIDIFNFALMSDEIAAISALDTGNEPGVDSDTMGH